MADSKIKVAGCKVTVDEETRMAWVFIPRQGALKQFVALLLAGMLDLGYSFVAEINGTLYFRK